MLAATFLQNHDIAVTPLRVELVEMLQQANRPISYDEFLSKIKANKSTIYRNLDILLSKNLIIKSEIEQRVFMSYQTMLKHILYVRRVIKWRR